MGSSSSSPDQMVDSTNTNQQHASIRNSGCSESVASSCPMSVDNNKIDPLNMVCFVFSG